VSCIRPRDEQQKSCAVFDQDSWAAAKGTVERGILPQPLRKPEAAVILRIARKTLYRKLEDAGHE
jgi:hypothetical protein